VDISGVPGARLSKLQGKVNKQQFLPKVENLRDGDRLL
jgi:hypothetical protein